MARTKGTGNDKTKEAPALEEKLWAAADKLRGHMDAAEYKHVVLGLIFLKYISDAFQEHFDRLKADKVTQESGAVPLVRRDVGEVGQGVPEPIDRRRPGNRAACRAGQGH